MWQIRCMVSLTSLPVYSEGCLTSFNYVYIVFLKLFTLCPIFNLLISDNDVAFLFFGHDSIKVQFKYCLYRATFIKNVWFSPWWLLVSNIYWTHSRMSSNWCLWRVLSFLAASWRPSAACTPPTWRRQAVNSGWQAGAGWDIKWFLFFFLHIAWFSPSLKSYTYTGLIMHIF